MHYRARFTCTCEVCGEMYSGAVGLKCPKNDALLAGDTLNAMSDSIDAKLTRKRVEDNVKYKNWQGLEVAPSTCPHCGAYQTWNPIEEPVKPNTKKGDRRMNIGIAILASMVLGVLGLLLGLIVYAIANEISKDGLYSDPFIIGGVALGVILGIAFAVFCAKTDDKTDDDYAKELDKYNETLARFKKIDEELKARETRNQPDVNLAGGNFGESLEGADYQSGRGSQTPCCPACKRKLQGFVKMNSIEQARASSHCCPWCGEKLPSWINIKV